MCRKAKEKMNQKYPLLEYYVRYLREIRGLKDSSVNHYIGAMNVISKWLRDRRMIRDSIYEITDIDELTGVRNYVFENPEFILKDKTGHQMYSAGFNNYYRFASGEDFSEVGENIELLDVQLIVGQQRLVTTNTWKRSGIIKRQSIEAAGYKCEIDSKHKTFLKEADRKPYMEGHHALPIRLQGDFQSSLDVYANIICLCPVCHRRIHYGLKEDRRLMLYKIYTDRAQRLANSGICMSKDEFVKMAEN